MKIMNWHKFDNKYRFLSLLIIMAMLTGCGISSESENTSSESENSSDSQTASDSDFAESDNQYAEEDKTDSDNIELLEPAGVAADYETVDYRNIYDAEVFDCIVSPAVEEYSYTTDETFGSYGVLPGQSVSAGDILIYGDSEEIETELSDIEDELVEIQSEHEETIADLYDDLYSARKTEYEASQVYGSKKNNEPDENSAGYSGWAASVMPSEGAYKEAELSRKRIEESILEENELYELEEEYYEGRKERLLQRQNTAQVTTDTDGTVVMCGNYVKGDSIQKNSAVMAVGDTDSKVLYAEGLTTKQAENAVDIYAFISGKRYEVEYTPMDQTEYQRLKKRDTDVYMPFYINDSNNEISLGEYGIIVLVSQERLNVLTVPADGVSWENGQYYVNRINGDDTEKVSVEIGMQGKMYTEILSGLEPGDKILTDKAVGSSKKVKKLELGQVSTQIKEDGELYYPSIEWITNPAKNGTSYISEICVKKYEAVSEGQELAKIEVESDTVEIARLQRKIERQQERLNKLNEEKSKNYSNEVDTALEKSIRQKEAAIERYNRQLDKLQEYSGIITLTAPCNGIVTDITSFEEGDLINNGENIIQISNTAESYVVMSGRSRDVSFGGTVTVSYKTGNKKEETEGRVVSVCDGALSGGLRQDLTLISMPEEVSQQLASQGSNQSDNGWSRSKYTITAEIQKMDNVILIPKSAVVYEGGDTFVKINTDDGRATYVQFISGGNDTENYWAVEGLEEGMEICLD